MHPIQALLLFFSLLIILLFSLMLRRPKDNQKEERRMKSGFYLDEERIKKILATQNKKGEGVIIHHEDEPSLQLCYREAIEYSGEKCISVIDAYELFDLLSHQKCKLLITGMLQNRVNGLEVIDIVRNTLKLKVPILVLSNVSAELMIKDAFELGADVYLVKTDIKTIEDLMTPIYKLIKK